MRHFGVEVQVFEPGAVSSGGAERAKVFLDKDDPYYPMVEQLTGFRTAPVTVDEVATVVADAIENTGVPFRVPVGEVAIAQLPGPQGSTGERAVRRGTAGLVELLGRKDSWAYVGTHGDATRR